MNERGRAISERIPLSRRLDTPLHCRLAGRIAMYLRDNLASQAVLQLLEKQGDTKLETRTELNALRDKCNEKKSVEQPWAARLRSVSAFLTAGKSFLTFW